MSIAKLSNRYFLQGDFIDSYYNNTIKTMMGLRWAVEACPKVSAISNLVLIAFKLIALLILSFPFIIQSNCHLILKDVELTVLCLL